MSIFVQKIWFIVRFFIIGAMGFSIFVLLYFCISQARFIYFPQAGIIATPAEIGLRYETVFFKTADEVKLSGWFIPAKESRGVILFCHGNAGNISHRLETIQTFYNLGLSVFIFDYRGYGESEGKPTEQGTYFDAEAAWQYLFQEKKVPSSEIIVFGRSVGGSIAAWLAQDHTVKALIIESAFTSIYDIGRELYPFIPIRLLSRFNYNTMQYLRKISCPVLIVHSRDDEIIPFNHGCKLFEAAVEPKQFLEIRGSHNEGFIISAEQYEAGLDSFISSML